MGRRVVPSLVKLGHEVTAVGRNPERREDLRRIGARIIALDIFDAMADRRAVQGHDAVVNLATHIPSSATRMLFPSAWRENTRIRQVASKLLAEAALEARARIFVQESFAPIYCDGGDQWVDESAPVEPASYNASVLDAERAAEQFTQGGGRGIVLRFAAFYGSDARHIVDLIGLVRKGLAPMPGSPEGFVSSISHDDAAAAVIAALNAPPGIYNVGDDEPLTRRAYVDALADALGVPHPRLPPAWLTYFMGPVARGLARSLRLSNAKLKHSTTWSPKYRSIREGWRATVADMR